MADPERCGHCGRTSHGFVCCGWLDPPCTEDHFAEPAPTRRTPRPGQSGPARPLRAPRRLDPRGTHR